MGGRYVRVSVHCLVNYGYVVSPRLPVEGPSHTSLRLCNPHMNYQGLLISDSVRLWRRWGGFCCYSDFSDRVSWCLQGCSFCPLCMCGCEAACIPLSSAVPWLLILMSVTKPSAGHIKYKMLSVDLFKSIILKHHIQNHNLRWTVKSLLRKGFIVVILEPGTQIILYHFYYQLLFDLHHQSISGRHNPFEYLCLLLLFLPAEGRRSNGDLHPTWGSLSIL